MDSVPLTEQQRAQAEYFDEKYVDEAPRVDFNHYERDRFGPWNPYWFVHHFVRERRSHGFQRLLNVGSGPGADAIRYAELGYHVEGIDISPRAVEMASESARAHGLEERARFSVQPGEKLDFPDGHFDLIVGVNVLHHMTIAAAVPEARRVLKRGGVAIFKEPLLTPVRDRILHGPPLRWVIPPGTKNIVRGTKYGHSEGERNLGPADFELIREHFDHLEIHRWRVLACLSVLFSNRPLLERWDWRMFRLLPFVRRFGDQAVLVARC